MKNLKTYINEALITEASKPILTVITYGGNENAFTKEEIEEEIRDFSVSSDNLVGWLNREAIVNKGSRDFPKKKEKIIELLNKICAHKNSIINIDSAEPAYKHYVKIQ
jgi:hypothetical protein